MGVRVKLLKSFDLPQIIYLVDAIEMRLHAFYCHRLPISKALSFQNLRKGTFSKLANQAILFKDLKSKWYLLCIIFNYYNIS